MRILIAEDEAIIRLDLRRQLEDEGFEVCAEARDGVEAVELARRLEPDLAILDVRMPRLDGVEAARRITTGRPIPIVILSAHSEKALVRKAVDAGISAYLVKPFDLRHLLPTIETALARHRELVAAGAAPSARTRRRRSATDERRREIRAAAARVFSAKGYESSTIQDIADAVGMLKGSLYYHISSKEDLLFDVVHDAAQRAAATLLDVPEGDPLARLQACMVGYGAFVRDNLASVTVSVRDGRTLAADRRATIDELRAIHVAGVASFVVEAQELGAVRTDVDAALVAETIVGMGDWIAHRDRRGGPGADDLVRAFVELVLGGLALPAALEAA